MGGLPSLQGMNQKSRRSASPHHCGATARCPRDHRAEAGDPPEEMRGESPQAPATTPASARVKLVLDRSDHIRNGEMTPTTVATTSIKIVVVVARRSSVVPVAYMGVPSPRVRMDDRKPSRRQRPSTDSRPWTDSVVTLTRHRHRAAEPPRAGVRSIRRRCASIRPREGETADSPGERATVNHPPRIGDRPAPHSPEIKPSPSNQAARAGRSPPRAREPAAPDRPRSACRGTAKAPAGPATPWARSRAVPRAPPRPARPGRPAHGRRATASNPLGPIPATTARRPSASTTPRPASRPGFVSRLPPSRPPGQRLIRHPTHKRESPQDAAKKITLPEMYRLPFSVARTQVQFF